MHFTYRNLFNHSIHIQCKLLVFLLNFDSFTFEHIKLLLKFILYSSHFFMSLIKMSFFWEKLKKIIRLVQIVWLYILNRISLSLLYLHRVQLKSSTVFVSKRSRNNRIINYSVRNVSSFSLNFRLLGLELTLVLYFLLFVEFLKLIWFTPSFLSDLLLFSLVQLVKFLLNFQFLVHVFTHYPLFFFLLLSFLLLNLILQVLLILVFTNLF